MKYLFLLVLSFVSISAYSENDLFWWQSSDGVNFGDDLSHVIVEKILGRPVQLASLESDRKTLLAAGSILHFARDDDLIWGSGFRENPMVENRFSRLDVRCVRGPRTRDFLLQKGINCPPVYGDPALLIAQLFPEFKKQEPIYDYIIIPNIGEIKGFIPYKNVVLPTLPWKEIVEMMQQSKLVISSSLHGIIVAESYNIPARLLKMTWGEPLLKYQDYYEATNRPDFKYATSVQEALQLGGERPGLIDLNPLLNSFPWDYFEH